MSRSAETRWLVVAADGRHVTLGRHRKPDGAELVRVGEGLEAQGLVGWFARMQGDYYGETAPALQRLRQLAGGEGDWEAARAAFERRRRASLPPG